MDSFLGLKGLMQRCLCCKLYEELCSPYDVSYDLTLFSILASFTTPPCPVFVSFQMTIIPRSFLFKIIQKKEMTWRPQISARLFSFTCHKKQKPLSRQNLRRFFFARWKSVKLVVKASSCLSLAMLNRCHKTSSPSIMTWCDMIWDATG